MSAANLSALKKLKDQGEKITCLTAYDATFARLLERAGIDMIMVGDSLGMVVQGQASTLPVQLEHMIYHCQNVRRGCSDKMFIVVDMPFMTYANAQDALANAAELLQQGLANMVKMEGGAALAETVSLLCSQGIAVCGHLGLTPQSVNKLGGYKVQGRDKKAAQKILDDALILEQAGIDMLVLECVPSIVGEAVAAKLSVPVIGIGAGAHCDGQVLVSYDMLGLSDLRPSFVKNFMADASSVEEAVKTYIRQVKDGVFPAAEHSYT